MRPQPRSLFLLAALGAAAVVVAGCGGGGHPAAAGNPATNTTMQTGPSDLSDLTTTANCSQLANLPSWLESALTVRTRRGEEDGRAPAAVRRQSSLGNPARLPDRRRRLRGGRRWSPGHLRQAGIAPQHDHDPEAAQARNLVRLVCLPQSSHEHRHVGAEELRGEIGADEQALRLRLRPRRRVVRPDGARSRGGV